MKAEKRLSLKTIALIQGCVMLYSFTSVAGKLASGYPFLSVGFVGFYGLEILLLGVYALCWQQIIKRVALSVAYANRAMALLWSMLWAALLFGEALTWKSWLGVAVVILGTMVVNSDGE